MIWLRNIIYWFILSIFSIVLFPIIVASIAISRRITHRLCTFWASCNADLLSHIVGLHYRVKGIENIPNTPSIICSKHQSGWETLALQKIFPAQVFVAKRSLFLIPIFGWALWMIKTIGIDRNNRNKAAQQILTQGLDRKNDGYWITIFPEGTRIKPGLRGRYKLGAARMAKQLEMNIVPVALNSGEFWPKNSFLKYPGTIDVVIGPTISYQLGGPEVLMQTCETWIESQQALIQDQGPFAAKPILDDHEERA